MTCNAWEVVRQSNNLTETKSTSVASDVVLDRQIVEQLYLKSVRQTCERVMRMCIYEIKGLDHVKQWSSSTE